MFKMIKLISCLILLLIGDGIKPEIFDQQPRIKVRNGHMILTAPRDKNISLETSGSGGLHLNGEDIAHLIRIARNATKALERVGGNFALSFDSYDPTKAAGFAEVSKRMEVIEVNLQNVTKIAASRDMFYRLNRRLNLIQRYVRKISTSLNFDDCQQNPCMNGGTCHDLFNAYICSCPDAWEGPNCTTDVNECNRYTGTDLGCQNGATCVNKRGGYECQCAPGWIGIHCTRRSADCNFGSKELCDHGTCVSQSNSVGYKCICDQGWTTDGKNPSCSVDVDECNSKKLPCSTNPFVQCINVPGSFYCGSCPPGFTGNGYDCIDIDECAVFNGGCSMNPAVQCINTPGSRTCGPCPPGYLGNGLICSYQGGVCTVNNGGCHPLAQCRDNSRISLSYADCVCPRGYKGNGFGQSGCIKTDYLDPCASNPCVHGTCSVNNLTNDYVCECGRKFTGKKCDIMKDPCVPNPCRNGGVCTPQLSFTYRCLCADSYTGFNCELRKEACGGTLEGYNGTVRFSTDKSPSGSTCIWTIKTHPSKVLKLTFAEFHLKRSDECQGSSLKIQDASLHSIAKFCGSDLPNGGSLNTSTNEVNLWLRVDGTSASFVMNWTSLVPVCGETINATSHGSIKSPGSPANYPLNSDCYWTIETALDKRVMFHFFSLIIGNNTDCNGDYLEFYSETTKEKPFGKYCTTGNPEPLQAPSPKTIVHFHSDDKNSYPGFQITYSVISGIPGCGGLYTLDNGTISSPQGIESPTTCEYKIKLPSDAKVKIEFISFDVGRATPDCAQEHVALYEGSTEDSPLIGRYCGSTVPAAYVSLTNQVSIFYKTQRAKGFTLKYSSVCSYTYTASNGVIQSSNYPSIERNAIECTYEIIQPPKTIIHLNIIDLKFGWPISINYLEVRDTGFDNVKQFQRFNRQYPSLVVSKYNYMRIYVKEMTRGGVKYYLNYTTTDVGCGGIFTSDLGSIQSPPYLPNSEVNCTWIIAAPKNHVIKLTWIYFQTAPSDLCKDDYVGIYNGDNTYRTGVGLIGKYCGAKKPPTQISSSDLLTIEYNATKKYLAQPTNFLLNYSFVLKTNVCGGDYFTSFGIISTPQFSTYGSVLFTCLWKIQVPLGSQISLNVTLDLAPIYPCAEFIEIRNGGSNASPLVGKYCSWMDKPPLITSHANNLYIKTVTNPYKRTNIVMSWESAATGCGGSLSSPTGSVSSPNYPEQFPWQTECYWKISVDAGSVIQFTFNDFDIFDSTCNTHVEIFDGLALNSPLLGVFCNTTDTTIKSNLSSTGNNALIKFKSTTVNGRGFLLKYSSECYTTSKGYYGVIEYTGFPAKRGSNYSCLWNIVAPRGNRINVTFTHFNVKMLYVIFNPRYFFYRRALNQTCSSTFVEIKFLNASTEEMETYDEYCSKNLPPPISISTKLVQILLSAIDIYAFAFRLEWEVTGCVQKLTRPKGFITTPNYPNAYPPDTECEWLIQTDLGSSVMLEFYEVDIDTTNDCTADYIEIYNGPDRSFPLLNKLCHSKNATIITSSGNAMFVRFQSDSLLEGRGFRANYTVTPTKCGGRLKASSGSFHSPNYPRNYDREDNCDWLIEVDEKHLIQLNFTDVDLPDDCENVYIKVYDGQSTDSRVLRTICGSNLPNSALLSTYNQLLVEMRSNSQTTSKGFRATFSTECGAVLTEASGIIRYAPAITNFTNLTAACEWTIMADRLDQHVSLTVTSLDNPDCKNPNHHLKVYSGFTVSSPLLRTYCGKIPPTLISTVSALHIFAVYGFTASYTTFDSACGGTLQNEKGYFASPGYPDNYFVNTECEWTIASSNGVTVTFAFFDLVQSEYCNDDFLEIRQKDSVGKLLGLFCGQTVPTNLTHVGPLWIYFKSSKPDTQGTVNTGRGFLAEYVLDRETELSGAAGKIFSPLYPNFYTKDDTYTWRITVDFRSKISLSFTDLNVRTTSKTKCAFTYVKLYDGYDETAPVLGSICSLSSTGLYETTSNVALIVASYRSMNGAKFAIEWTRLDHVDTSTPKPEANECGSSEVINLSNGQNYTIQSPGYPNGYSQGQHCEWIFSTSQEEHLNLYFTYIDLIDYDGYCYYDAVRIYGRVDGSMDWDTLETVCLQNQTFKEITSTNQMKVEFNSDHNGNQTGFSAVAYSRCGGNIKKSNGFITVDNSTYGFGKMLSCQWNITVRPGRTMEIKFRSFDLGYNKDRHCENYVLLRNGQYADSPLLGNGKYCGNVQPDILTTTGYHLYIEFVAGNKIKGFVLEYKEASTNCENKISLTNSHNSTTISSPNYPNIPVPHTECTWVITAPSGESIKVDFIDRFDMTKSKDCALEYVEMRDGGTVNSRFKGRWCGETPSTQLSEDNVIFIKFFTDVNSPKNGFKAAVSIADCGGTIRGVIGEIKSADYVKQTNWKELNCTWQIIGPEGHYLSINIEYFKLPRSLAKDCAKNYIELVENKINNTQAKWEKFCSETSQPIQTSANSVKIRYKTKFSEAANFIITYNASKETCGGRLQNDVGYIRSPDYPFLRYAQRFCRWSIKVPEGRRIRVEVLDFDLDSAASRYKQMVAFYNGEGAYIGRNKILLPGDNTKFINSTDNQMTIVFMFTHPSYHRGFLFMYTSNEPTLCVGDFKQSSGVISSPLGLSSYSCTWIRFGSSPVNQTISITINATIYKEMKDAFMRNLVIVTTGDNDQKLADISSEPETVRAPDEITKLITIQQANQKQLNFTAVYKTYMCGGTVTQSEGQISSPHSPGKTIECVWIIKVGESQSIKVNFTSMDLGDDCDKNFVVFKNGLLRTDPEIGRYCRRLSPVGIQSQSNSLWIEYRSDAESTGKGFNLMYESVESGCGGVIHDDTRTIKTPSYPQDYPNNAECVWELHADNGYHIGLEFVDRFHLEQSDRCRNDFVEISEHQGKKWSSLQKMCGRDRPTHINSTSNEMQIVFRSNEAKAASGFKIRWHVNCGSDVVAKEKINYIVSPGYPISYKNNMTCVYRIAAPNQQIRVVFESFHIEYGFSCQFDNVTIESISFEYPKTKRVYCGLKKPPSFLVYEHVDIKFQSDNFRTYSGFKFSYQIYKCGGNITKPTLISSPEIPKKPHTYELNSCSWYIRAPRDKIVIVRFESFLLQHDSQCWTNYVALYDGFNMTEENRLALLCGNLSHNLPVIKSNGHKMTFNFGCYGSSPPANFKAMIYFMYGPDSGCGGVINLKNGTSQTIQGPKGLSYVDCQWQIQTEYGYVIALNLLEKDSCIVNSTKIHNVKHCICSLFEIRDGGGPFSELMAEICDQSASTSYTTSGSQAWVRWLTNGFNAGKAFKLQVSSVPTICGETKLTATNSTRQLRSPNFPDAYPANTKCFWQIKTDDYSYLVLKFSKFDLGYEESARNCNDDRVEISDNSQTKVILDGLSSSTIYRVSGSSEIYDYSPLVTGVHQYCGKTSKEFEYYSQENEVTVSFYSGSGNHGEGFELEYESIGCNRNYTSTQGRLISGVNPTICLTRIVAPENTTISLYFMKFYVSFAVTSKCGHSVLRIFDGDSESSPLLAELCGYEIPNPIFTNQNKMLLRLDNKDASYVNYDLTYVSTKQGRGCGGAIYNYQGKLTSPLYPNNHRKIAECVWDIYVPPNFDSAIKFTVFNLLAPCTSDYLIVTTYEKGQPNEHRYCTNDNPPILHSSNRITVTYKTSFNNGGSGWVAQFIALADGQVLKW